MKKVLSISLALTLCASAAFAVHMGTFSDEAGTSCALTNLVPFPAKNQAFVIHKFNAAGATGAQFGILDASGLAFSGYTSPYIVLGTLDNLNIGYGPCVAGDLKIMTLEWYALGGNFTCANKVSLVPATATPIPGEIVVVNCDYSYSVASGGILYVGPDSQNCVDPSACNPNPVNETTWGGIKALYR